MNKAFVKDPEPQEPRCPQPRGCDQIGEAVSRETLEQQLGAERAQGFSGAVAWCSSPDCKIAYFDRWGQTVPVDELERVPWPKDSRAPICPCEQVEAPALRAEAEAGQRDTVKRILARAEGDDANCRHLSPTGRSCTTAVRKLFLEHFRPE